MSSDCDACSPRELLAGRLHAPRAYILMRRHAHRARKTADEMRVRQRHDGRQLRDADVLVEVRIDPFDQPAKTQRTQRTLTAGWQAAAKSRDQQAPVQLHDERFEFGGVAPRRSAQQRTHPRNQTPDDGIA
jgi:hypothetical protein